MTSLERGKFVKLFNRGGWVLDFTTSDFDTFTMSSVGIALCAKYNLSKGKSLNKFIEDNADELADKLLLDLLKYYENSYEPFENETKDNMTDFLGNPIKSEYSSLYKECKIIELKNSPNYYSSSTAQTIKDAFSSEYIDSQIDIMLRMQNENPTEAIGKAKELIESCCKAILEANNIVYDQNWKLSKLTDETVKFLKITPKHIPDNIPAAESIKAILGNLRSIATHIAELRNPYGSGHGKSPDFKGLEARHAKLAVGSSLTLVNFLWDSFLRYKEINDNDR